MDTVSIKPTPQRAGRVELCGLDMTGCRYCESIAVFSPAFDVERFREALARSLDLYPFLAATLAQEGKRLFLDLDGPGVQFAYEESPEPCPPWGPDVLQLNARNLFLPIPWREKRSPDRRVLGKPLFFVKLTRFPDGHYVFANSLCHAVCDGKAASRWFEDLHRLYSGEEISATPLFGRQSLLALGDPDAHSPAPGSTSVTRPFPPTDLHQGPRVEPVYACFPLPDEQRGMLISIAAREHRLGISEHDLLHGLLLKSFARALPETMTHVALSQPYDARRIKGLGFPTNYVGNAVLSRLVRLPRVEAIDEPLAQLAARLAETLRPTAAQARQEIGFRQREYVAGHVDDFCNLTSTLPAIGRDTLSVNNMAHSTRSMQAPFRGTLLWSDLAINEPLGVRSAWIFGNSARKESHKIRVVLPPEQAAPFRSAWEQGMAELAASCASRAARAAERIHPDRIAAR